MTTRRRLPSLARRPRIRRRFAAGGLCLLGLSACGSASVQDRAADAVNAYIEGDEVLADADFDPACVDSTARGLTDEVAQAVLDDGGRVDFDVAERDRDDVYDFYNCADERDLARVIADRLGDPASRSCLEDVFDRRGASDFLNDQDADAPARLGDFANVTADACDDPDPGTTVPPSSVPAKTIPPTTTAPTAPPSTTPPTTTPPTTAPPTTAPPTTAPPTTVPPAPPSTTGSQSMPGASTPADYAFESASFLDDDPAVSTAVGGDVLGVVCTPPSRTTIGTNYLCFGEAASFGPIEFTVEIDGVDSFLVTDFRAAPSAIKITFVDALVVGLTDEDLLVDQVCVREVVDGLPDADVRVVVDNIDAADFPGGLSFDEDDLTTMLFDCVSV